MERYVETGNAKCIRIRGNCSREITVQHTGRYTTNIYFGAPITPAEPLVLSDICSTTPQQIN